MSRHSPLTIRIAAALAAIAVAASFAAAQPLDPIVHCACRRGH
jgi:hypothetical protein